MSEGFSSLLCGIGNLSLDSQISQVCGEKVTYDNFWDIRMGRDKVEERVAIEFHWWFPM